MGGDIVCMFIRQAPKINWRHKVLPYVVLLSLLLFLTCSSGSTQTRNQIKRKKETAAPSWHMCIITLCTLENLTKQQLRSAQEAPLPSIFSLQSKSLTSQQWLSRISPFRRPSCCVQLLNVSFTSWFYFSFVLVELLFLLVFLQIVELIGAAWL